MSMDDENNFSKQRRNLIFISAVLLAKDFLEVDYSKFDLFKSGITIGNPDGIYIILWMMWGYFLLRFFSLFYETENTFSSPIRKKYTTYLEKATNTHINKDVEPDFFPAHRSVNVNFNDSSIFDPYFSIWDNDGNLLKNWRTINDFNFKRIRLLKYYLFSIFYYIFKTHYFLEYYFPILFASLPALILIYKTLRASAPLW